MLTTINVYRYFEHKGDFMNNIVRASYTNLFVNVNDVTIISC